MPRYLIPLAILAVCGLNACAATSERTAPSAVETPDSAPTADTTSGAAPETADNASSEEAAPLPPPRPESLVGLTSDELETLLGKPAHIIQEPPAQIWRYSVDLCKLFFFLYESGEDGLPSVRHVDVAIADGAQIQPHLCLSGVSLSGLPAEPVEGIEADPMLAPAIETD